MRSAPAGPPGCTWSGRAWRYTPTDRGPLDPTGSLLHGGRWNPAGTFAALYLGTPRQTVLDDLAAAVRALDLGAADLPDFVLHEVQVSAVRLLDLSTPEACVSVGLQQADLVAAGRAACQHVGETAWRCGWQGVLAPSATGSGLVLAVFPDRVSAGAMVVVRTAHLGRDT